jgi:DNA-binding transcriptional regulator YdaS (Cro superfamily)
MENPKTRTMRRAVHTLGGAKALADAFGVKPELVESWLAGTASPGNAHYLAALDIVAHGSLGEGPKGSRKK